MVFSKSGQSNHFCCACSFWCCELKVFFRCGTVKSGMYSTTTREAIIMCLKLIITEEYDKKGVLIVLHATWQLNLLLIWLKSCCQIGRGVDLWLQPREKVSCFAMSVCTGGWQSGMPFQMYHRHDPHQS